MSMSDVEQAPGDRPTSDPDRIDTGDNTDAAVRLLAFLPLAERLKREMRHSWLSDGWLRGHFGCAGGLVVDGGRD